MQNFIYLNANQQITLLYEWFDLTTNFTLQCRECGTSYPPTKRYICEECFGPLEVAYNYNLIHVNRRSFQSRPRNLWRYRELLPITDFSKVVDIGAGYTPLHKADRLGEKLGIKELYVKNDAVNPTYSFKDRPVAIAASKAVEFRADALGCASTGNLAASTAAYAAKAGLPCSVFIPDNTEYNKTIQIGIYGAKIFAVRGTYDTANRLAMQIAEECNWVFANHNVRPYYVEGSKTLAFEVCEQLQWTPPDHVIIPTGSGALLNAIGRGFHEFEQLNLIDTNSVKLTCAQPSGCAPIPVAFKKGEEIVTPIECPTTIAKSLAIGDPGDGYYALQRIRQSGGFAESATDEEIVEGITLLARTEGLFTEPAGGVTIAVLKKLIQNGQISADETVVCYITGNGLKTTEAISEHVASWITIEPTMTSFHEATSLLEVPVWSR